MQRYFKIKLLHFFNFYQNIKVRTEIFFMTKWQLQKKIKKNRLKIC